MAELPRGCQSKTLYGRPSVAAPVTYSMTLLPESTMMSELPLAAPAPHPRPHFATICRSSQMFPEEVHHNAKKKN